MGLDGECTYFSLVAVDQDGVVGLVENDFEDLVHGLL